MLRSAILLFCAAKCFGVHNPHRLRIGETVQSPASNYHICKRLGAGDNSEVVSAVSSPPYVVVDAKAACFAPPAGSITVALKCSLIVTPEENFPAQFDLMKSLEQQGQHWCPRAYEYFTRSDGTHCISMEELGNDLQKLRSPKFTSNADWPVDTIASIAVVMIDVLKAIHAIGYTHTDTHAGNWVLAKNDRTQLRLIDLGYFAPLAAHRCKSESELIVEELQQFAMTVRFLVDGDENFYQAKNYAYSETGVCVGVPESVCAVIKRVYAITPVSFHEGVYDEIRSSLLDVARQSHPEYAGGHVLWTPTAVTKLNPPTIESTTDSRETRRQIQRGNNPSSASDMVDGNRLPSSSATASVFYSTIATITILLMLSC